MIARRTLVALMACALPATALGAPSSAGSSLAGAGAIVRKLYAGNPDTSASALERLYTPDLARALIADLDPNHVSAIGFDIRYGDVDWKVQDLAFDTHPAPGGGALVSARLRTFNLPLRVDWRLTRAGGRWRIAEVSAAPQNDLPGWSLRQMLKLKPLEP